MISLSIIVASSGRETLHRTLASIQCQMRDEDQLLLDVNHDSPWGHHSRNLLMWAARGDYLLFMDDDDCYTVGALDVVRTKVATDPRRMHIFRMRYAHGAELWTDKEVRCGNVSTQMIAVPRWIPTSTGSFGPPTPWWGDRYEGDFDFIEGVARFGEPAWHEDVIALIRPR